MTRAELRRRVARRMASSGVSTAFAIVVLMVVSSYGDSLLPTSATTMPGKQKQFNSAIDHIVFLIQENHAFDSLYGTYCSAIGKYCPYTANGVPAGTCVPVNPWMTSGPCSTPYNFSMANLGPADMTHDWNSTHQAENGGLMNNFWHAEGLRNETYGHYNGTTAPVYWNLAEEYGLADNFFSPAASYSLPNHWFAVAGSAPNISYSVTLAVNGTPVSTLHTYLNQSNATPTLEDRLNHSKYSWKYYDYALAGYNWSIQPTSTSPAYSYWNPLAAREVSYKWRDRPHFVPRNQFFTDAANGSLPNVSWIIPSVPNSDHPPFNLSTGQSWVASVVDAIEASPDWNTTALFITWDEYGGFYDHVAPPALDAYGDSIRVPLIVVSPYAVQGYIGHNAMDFDSIVALMEARFHLPCLTARDCKATTPLAFFNFNKGPRAPIYIPPFANATYPMPLQSSGTLPYYSPALFPPPAPPPDTAVGPFENVLSWA